MSIEGVYHRREDWLLAVYVHTLMGIDASKEQARWSLPLPLTIELGRH